MSTWVWSLLMTAGVVGCGPGLRPERPTTPGDAVAPSDLEHLDKLVRQPVVNGGVLFLEAACAKQFASPGQVGADQLNAFAACLAGLHVHPSVRKDSRGDVMVLDYEPGIELEARFVKDDRGPVLSWIGYASRAESDDVIPTLTAAALEQLRASGDRTLDASSRAELEHERTERHVFAQMAWIKVCLDAQGAVSSLRVRDESTRVSTRVFTTIAQRLAFRPFSVGGQPMPACSMMWFADPAEKAPPEILPRQLRSRSGLPIIRETMLDRVRVDRLVVPSDDGKVALAKAGIGKIVGLVEACLDETGQVVSAQMIKNTGLASYDQKIVETVKSYIYGPYLEDGKPIAVCVNIPFVYSQH
jgi:hypothetical protein